MAENEKKTETTTEETAVRQQRAADFAKELKALREPHMLVYQLDNRNSIVTYNAYFPEFIDMLGNAAYACANNYGVKTAATLSGRDDMAAFADALDHVLAAARTVALARYGSLHKPGKND